VPKGTAGKLLFRYKIQDTRYLIAEQCDQLLFEELLTTLLQGDDPSKRNHRLQPVIRYAFLDRAFAIG
jgi:hypothetical protein